MSVIPPLVDSHCHFDFAAFDPDRAAVWAAAQGVGVGQLIIPGVAPDQWQAAAQVSAKYSGIYCAAGVHPWWVKDLVGADLSTQQRDKMRDQLRKTLTASPCVAVGECGLDKLVDGHFEHQQQLFSMQVELACELNMPLIIHCRKAHNEVIALLRRHRPPAGGVIHAFSGSTRIAETYIDMGFYLGIGGTITYERAHKTRQAVSDVPLTALLLESDAPDMPLCGRQGERNSPQYLPETLRILAGLREQSVAEVAAQTTNNTRRLFRLPDEVG
ncbi:MAG TPA: TatD family hydrolase [Cellvibrio sp.]|nr:TatD family hydrolase [Cellvibrio sp.]